MPTSGQHRVVPVVGVLKHCDPMPQSVLDIGVGFGKYGFVFREEIDIRKGRHYDRKEWQTRIDGVEVWEKYITPMHRYLYSNLYIGDIKEILPELGKYDLIVLADVLEHMPYKEGQELLDRLLQSHCRQAIVVSYPPVIGSEWKLWENPHEKHHFIWTPEIFVVRYQNMKDVKVVFNGTQVVYLLKEF